MNDSPLPLVSVILPAYNAEKYITESVLSILNQSYNNLELIIVNDGSVDNTEKLVLELAQFDERIKLISTKNQGVASALNVGISISNGSYIARMDSDDIALESRIETQVSFLMQNPSVGIVGSLASIIDENGSDLKIISCKPKSHNCLVWSMLFSNPFIHPTVMMRADLAKNILYRKTPSEDYDFWVRAAFEARFHNIQKVLLKYRVHSTQLTHSLYSESNNLSVYKNRQTIYNFFGLADISYDIFYASRVRGGLKLNGLTAYLVFFVKCLSAGFYYNPLRMVGQSACIALTGLKVFYRDTKPLWRGAVFIFIIIFIFALVIATIKKIFIRNDKAFNPLS